MSEIDNTIEIVKERLKYWDYKKALDEKRYKFNEKEWADFEINKYIILYDHLIKSFDVQFDNDLIYLGATYFKTQEDAQYMIDNYSEEMLKWGLM